MYYNARYVICQRLNFSKEEHALSYNACSSFGNELNPETNLAAFSLNIANNTPIITNGITKTPHSQNPIFIAYSSFTNSDLPHLHYTTQPQHSQSAANFTNTVPAMRSFHVEKLEFISPLVQVFSQKEYILHTAYST